jgi:LuxR family maltose regulon positive regulatory protein
MLAGKHSIPIYKTKLHRPRVARDFMLREALDVLLDHSPDHPLILVSAPAGYGKSSVVSHWLETRGHLNAWLSLDEVDSEVRVFLTYLVAAVNTVFPDACAETAVQLLEETLPPLPALAGCLCNDLDALEEPFVLVLDDYHHINETAVHDLLNQLLKHPPRSLQLLVISRRDPPFLLGALRAHSKVTEVRARDLMFTHAETRAFLDQATDRTFSSAAIAHLHQTNEGWVAGLRLAVLALQNHKDVDAFLLGFDCDVSGVQNFLLEEVLAALPPRMVKRLCATSILTRFSAPLCEAVGSSVAEGDEDPFDGSYFLNFLQDSGLFCVSLDEQGKWFRYHHLFQELLQRQLKKRFTQDGIASLHRHAAAWFEAQGLLKEAIYHTQTGIGVVEAARLLIRHRNKIMNGEQWHHLERWLKRLAEQPSQDDPDLLTLIAWDLQHQGRYMEAFQVLDRIEGILSKEPQDSADYIRLRGAVNALRGFQYFYEGKADLALNCAKQALTELPADCLSERSYAFMVMAGAMRTNGDLEGARKVIYHEIADTSIPVGTFQCQLLMALSVLNWTAADLPAMLMVAGQQLKLAEALGLAESIMNARYLQGSVHYHQNELSKAETDLVPVVGNPKVSNQVFFTESVFALASVYQAMGQTDKARETVDSACEWLLSIQNMTLLSRAQSYQADLALRQGRMDEALSWAQQCEFSSFHSMYRFYEPRLTLARVLMAHGSADSLEQADSLLTRLETFVTGVHNTRFLIDVLALRAMFHDQKGEESAALLALGRAVYLAQPGGFIRLFIDLGPRLVGLLNRLDLDADGLGYVQRIINAYQGDVKTEAGEALEHPLSKRELEILGLLSKQLTNKQIADQLFIAPATVKRHTENIYQKLDMPGRHQAVARAKELAIKLP